MGLFEDAFEAKKKEFGMVDKPVVTQQNKQQLSRPMITKPQAQQPQIIINVNGGRQGYKQRPMRQTPRRIPRAKKKSPKKQEYIVTKKDLEQGAKYAKQGAKAVGSGAKKAFGFFKKKASGKKSMQDRTLKQKIKGSIYK